MQNFISIVLYSLSLNVFHSFRYRYFTYFFALVSLLSNAQDKNDTAIRVIDKYRKYLSTTRKSIHLHLNKTTQISGEKIWFSIYIFNQKDNVISLEEEYVHVNLINDLGEIVASKTVLYSVDMGFNSIHLAPYLPSGNYYLQAYTPTMEDFIEDDSALYKIKVLNFEDDISSISDEKVSNSEIHIDVQAESGHLLDGITGTCAIRITDNNNNPVVPDKVLLKNSNDLITSKIDINALGLGNFSLLPKTNTQYLIEASIGDKVYTKNVPFKDKLGFTILAAHNFEKERLHITINTNYKNIELNLSLIVHKDGNIFTLPVDLKKKNSKAEISIPFSKLFKGVNTLSLLWDDKIVAERLVFIYPKNNNQSIEVNEIELENDSLVIHLTNNSKYLKSIVNRMSVSVLPENSLSDIKIQDISSSLLLSWYLPEGIVSQLKGIPFERDSTAKYLVDNALMLQGRGRYDWKNICNPNLIIPKNNIKLNQIDGYVNLFNTKNDSLTVKLFSSENGLLRSALLSPDKKFRFNNVILEKNSNFSLTLTNKKGKSIYANFFFTMMPQKNKYRHHFTPIAASKSVSDIKISGRTNPYFMKVEKLDSVTVTASKLKYAKFFGNFDGRKIDNILVNKGTLENYIRSYGFPITYVETNHPYQKIAGTRQFKKICNGNYIFTPMVVVDGVFDPYAMNYGWLRLEHIDEIYYKSGCPALFVVFTNQKYKNRPLLESQKKTKLFTAKNGYDASEPFIRPEYYTLTNRSFEYFGVISWFPNIKLDNKGAISLKIPNDGLKKLKLEVQGFTDVGSLITEQVLIDLSKGK